ncbi:arylamine N-acetyltransferase [Streptomyces sp. UNOC14_S4]|uniref:arylamine N-acetyltransferase family protein n=1 Tax=Streptomyces sp. UNOC14_S4 TaxID=2872340 RepID=UPI001E49A3B0|nr:arylamine N-acetyltransferase [Streptomyces sp. UNOC14_S4]MCC3767951.1 arylamine N-acetyltransferase [Streptomyces sp. UNOC14_S4]
MTETTAPAATGRSTLPGTLDDEAVESYLRRIGAKRPERPDLASLRMLHERHVLSVPFENIDFHLGTRPRLAIGADALPKIIDRNRGGGCYELNGGFREVLLALGYEAELMAARVWDFGEPGPLMGHMVLRVRAEDSPHPWLFDVGYGRGFRFPLRLDDRAPQEDPHGTFQLADAPEGDVDVLRKGRIQYRIETRPRVLDDFRPTLMWFENVPDSPFYTQFFCTLATAHGRVTIHGNTLTRDEDGERTRVELPDDEAVRDAYRTWFGFELTDLPTPPGQQAG